MEFISYKWILESNFEGKWCGVGSQNFIEFEKSFLLKHIIKFFYTL